VAKTINDDLTNRGTWMRLLYMILFAVIFNIAEMVVAVIVVFQFLSSLFTGKPNQELRGLGNTLGAYAHEIIAYLTYHSDDRPYPFGPWPAPAGGATPKPPKRARKAKSPSAAQPPEPQAADSGD
jgi:hypothetical protein